MSTRTGRPVFPSPQSNPESHALSPRSGALHKHDRKISSAELELHHRSQASTTGARRSFPPRPAVPPTLNMAMTVDQKRLRATKFPPEFDTKVDTEKVNIDLMKKWIASKITDLLGIEDDVVVEMVFNLLEQNRFVCLHLPIGVAPADTLGQPKIKEIQIQLDGFLGEKCAPFCKELWNLMISAQNSTAGVPKELLEAKKLELKAEQVCGSTALVRRDMADSVPGFQGSGRVSPETTGEGAERHD